MPIKVYNGSEWVQVSNGSNGTDGTDGTTINNNADNKVITGSDTSATLNAEANLTFDGTTLISAKIQSGLKVEDHNASSAGDKTFAQANRSIIYRCTGLRSGDEFSIPNNTLEAGVSISVFNTQTSVAQIGVDANVTVWLAGSNVSVTNGGSSSAILLAPQGLATIICLTKSGSSEFVVSGGGVYIN